MKRVAIIGAGISGLTAALQLSRSQLDVQAVLFEGSDRAGGVLETIYDGRYLIERSADNFATLVPDAMALCQELGLDAELISPANNNRQAFVLNRGRILPIPAGFSLMQPTRIASVLATRTLSWSAKLRLLGEFWVPRRVGDPDSDESLESFATRRLGREAYESLVEPIVSGIFTANPATLSMQATMPQFMEMERSSGGLIRGHLAARKQDSAAAARRASGARYDQFVAPKKGMSDWVKSLTLQLPPNCLQLKQPVYAVQQALDGQGWMLEMENGQQAFDALICATPAAVSAKLLQPVLPEVASWVGSIPYASSAVVAMVVPSSELTGRTDGFGLIIPRKERLQTLAISYSSNKYPGRVPEGELLLRIFLGGALNPDAVNREDNELLELVSKELRQVLGWSGSVPKWQAIIRWRDAMPQYLVGHVQRMRELNNYLTNYPTLKLCGAGYAGVGIPQCVRGGKQAANAILDYFRERKSDSSG